MLLPPSAEAISGSLPSAPGSGPNTRQIRPRGISGSPSARCAARRRCAAWLCWIVGWNELKPSSRSRSACCANAAGTASRIVVRVRNARIRMAVMFRAAMAISWRGCHAAARFAEGFSERTRELSKEFLEFLLRRRSAPIAGLREPAPEGEELHRILTAAVRVPDHGRLAPWRFILYRGEARHRVGEMLAELAER